MGMQHATGSWMLAMNLGMNAEGGGLKRVTAFKHIAFAINQQHVAGAHKRPVDSMWINQEPLVFARYLVTEMIADTLTEIETRRQAQRRRKVYTGLLNDFGHTSFSPE
jgi:hypothetical protein